MVETRVQALLASVHDFPWGKVRPCGIHELVNSLKLRKFLGLDGISQASSKKTTGISDTFT
jgi:hypothetical protein